MPQNILKNLAIILLFSVSVTAFAAGNGLHIYFPREGSVVNSGTIHVIGSQGSEKPVTIQVDKRNYKVENFQKAQDIDSIKGTSFMFMQKVSLKEGLNLITIKADAGVEKINVRYVTSMEAYKNKMKKKTHFHMNEDKTICKSCHTFETNKGCRSCHKEKGNDKFIHGPAAAWKCLQCHDKNNYLVPFKPVSSKCIQCHQEFSEKMYNANYAHGPAISGYCTICHDPHGADNRYLLKAAVNKLCNNCHTAKKSGVHVLANFTGNAHPTSGVIIKSTGKEISCVSCHNPHYGKTPQMFQNGAEKFMTLCAECHEDKF
ncbi:cytochrome C family protein [Flexistipes sinusarabici DSM 4947]|uniref:Cytochrome C family protein n=1 Tax=Flexistipes sinusarabici (strain ATCC 49648 / DSM 4947 / MAS 10) TaxID=717231 RepID=F8E4S4_FLESM|nr:cytochrome c3 family protein [Flexistipes sinusarabici]AEI15632.1 cytochrome C family protein [Flexistipes sinusarabici DSM 4947]